MVMDEPAFAKQLGPAMAGRVDKVARAMCNCTSREDGGEPCSCPWDGGTCVAFGLYGDLAFAALIAMQGH